MFPVAIGASEGEALRAWVTNEGARRTIEIRLGYGVSALFIVDGLLSNSVLDPHHVVVDPHQATRFADCGLQVLAEAGLRPRGAPPGEVPGRAPRFLSEGRTFDLRFVDGNHRFDGCSWT